MENAPETALAPAWTEAPSALQLRMQRLEERVGDCRERLDSQNQAVVDIYHVTQDLQSRARAMRDSVLGMTEQLQALGVGVAQVPRPAADPFPPPQIVAVTPPPPPPSSAAPDQGRPSFMAHAAPYLILIAAGLCYGLQSQATPAPVLVAAQAPAPAPEASPENAALQLVYEYRLPGTERAVLEMVGLQEAVLGPSPWDIACSGEDRCSVSFTGGDGTPAYEFDVDLAAQTATPSPETAAKLRSASLAQHLPD